jgi:hypothetical protein
MGSNSSCPLLAFLVGTDGNRAKVRQSAGRDTRSPGALPEHRQLSIRRTNVGRGHRRRTGATGVRKLARWQVRSS